MKKTLCFALLLALLLTMTACGQKKEAAPEPTPEPTEAVPPTPEKRAAEYLRSRDYDYVVNNLGVYLEYYRLTHPGAEVDYAGYKAMYPYIRLDLCGADARAFAESGLLPDFVSFRFDFTVDDAQIRFFTHGGFPEAAMLLEGLPENVASAAVGRVLWPDQSYEWRVTETRNISNRLLVRMLLGEGAVYDPETETYQDGERTLDLTDGARLSCDTQIARALTLTLTRRRRETLDPRDIPTLEEAGWIYEQFTALELNEIPFLERLYGRRRERVTLTDGAGEERTFDLINAGCFDIYVPDLGTLNARLAAALEEERARLGEEAFRAEYGDLEGFAFTGEDLKDLYLVRVPFRAILGTVLNYDYLSPWGELASSAAWMLYSGRLGLLALDAPYLGYSLEPKNTTREDTGAPEKALKKLLDRLSGEEVKLLSMDFVLVDGYGYERDLRYGSHDDVKKRTIEPMWRVRGETAQGEERVWLVSMNAQSCYDLMERCYLETAQDRMYDLFREYSAAHPEADVWYSGCALLRGEDGKEYLRVDCYGVDLPELEASGFLPRGTVLDYSEPPFNQKESHPCPHEAEWEKKYWSEEREDAVTLTMGQASYPLYPDCVEVTVRCGKAFQRYNVFGFEKYVDGEWKPIWQTSATIMIPFYVEAGETAIQVPTRAKLGEGLYRLYITREYWVEFAVSAETR